MLKNYLKIALRQIKKYKFHSFINIFGLSIGMAMCIIVFLFVQEELSYDRFHEKSGQIYRIINNRKSANGEIVVNTKTFAWMAPEIKNVCPEIQKSARVYDFGMCNIGFGNSKFAEQPFFADPDMLNIFDFPLLKGDRETALNNPNSAIITEDLARKFFFDEDPLGKILNIEGKFDFIITGVMKNIPENSHLKFGFLGNINFLKKDLGAEQFNKNNYSVRTYILLDKNANKNELEKNINGCIASKKGSNYASNNYFIVQSLIDIHLYSNAKIDIGKNGNIFYLNLLVIIAIIIMIIACINFMNLTTARSSLRFKEIGLRKVIGAERKQIIKQFILESFIFSIIAFLIAVLLAEIFLPQFNSILEKNLTINFKSNLSFYFYSGCLILLVGGFSGGFMSFSFSSLKPVEIFKQDFKKKSFIGALMRKGFVLLQFIVSSVFIIAMIILYHQFTYMKNKDLGFNSEYIINIRTDETLLKNSTALKEKLKQNPAILETTSALMPPGISAGLPLSVKNENNEDITLYLCEVDYNYFDFFNIGFLNGRNFSSEIISDEKSALIINESAARLLAYNQAKQKKIISESWGVNGNVIGVVKDFHNASLREEIKPSVYRLNPIDCYNFFIKIRANKAIEIIPYIKNVVIGISPNLVFDYLFLDEQIERLYKTEKTMNTIFLMAALISIIIASLGLLGLVSYAVQKRTKEIGIRKILGSTIHEIFILLTREMVALALIAVVVSIPVVLFFMDSWLKNYVYRINIELWHFIMGGSVLFFISLSASGFIIIKNALKNPVESLKNE